MNEAEQRLADLTALELAQEGEAIAAKIGTGPPFSADTPWPAQYAEMIESIRRAAEIPPPQFDRIKLTREQFAGIPHAEPSPFHAAASGHVSLLNIPVELVEDVVLSTPYEYGQAKIRAAVGAGQCLVACALTDEARVTDAVAGLPGIEVRPVPFLDPGDVLVLDKTVVERPAAYRYPWSMS